MPPSLEAARRRGRSLATDLRVRDQVLTSLTNLAMPIVAALLLSSHEVGAIWIAFGAYQVAIALCRGFIALPGQIAIGRQSPAAHTPTVRSIVSLPVALALVTAATAVAIPDRDVRSCLLVLAAALPVLLLLDSVRHWAYAVQRVELPARASAEWAALYFVAATVAVAAGPTAATLLAAWAIPGIVAGVRLLLAVRPLADPAVAAMMSLSQRMFLAADAVTGQLAAFVVPAIAGVVATLSEVGVFQNSRLLFRPVNVLLNLLLVGGIPHVTNAKEGAARLHRTRQIAVKTVVVTCVLTALGLVGYVAATLTDVELSWPAIGFAAAESIAVGPYIAYALLATTMMRAGTLLSIRVAAVVVQIAGVLLLAGSGAGGLAAASLAGMLVPSIVVPWWTTRFLHRPAAQPVTPQPTSPLSA